jgi:ribosome-binding ATPase YchF (GTP1/OBG family)/predicted esterase
MKKIRILALHGLRQDGDLFANKLLPLVNELVDIADFKFPHAPYAANTNLKATENEIERSWFSAATSTHLDAEALASISSVVDHGSEEPFDVVFGFSQGCCAAVALLALPEAQRPKSCANIRGLVLVSSPEVDENEARQIQPLSSLHVAGENDAIVPFAVSLGVASLFDRSQLFTHSGKHAVPMNREAMMTFRNFLSALQTPLDLSDFRQLVNDEISVLEAVFGDNLTRAADDASDGSIEFLVTLSTDMHGQQPVLKVCVPPHYPRGVPLVAMVNPSVRHVPWGRQVMLAVERAAQERIGIPGVLFELLNVATEEINEAWNKAAAGSSVEQAEEHNKFACWDSCAEDEKSAAVCNAYDSSALLKFDDELKTLSRSSGGRMRYIIGLVGKPSAGKSTFFNAITDPQAETQAAKVGAFPFTTIEPNFGDAFVGVPCACEWLDLQSTCEAEHGHFPGTSLRRCPVLVKDVAGLVPGAYQGRGKGNRFLNDLCDASVLVHIVDGSGTSTVNGEHDPDNASSPVQDIRWIRHEIHSWIFDNVRSKWEIIAKRPVKFLAMFSGYHAPLALIEGILKSVFSITPATMQDTLPRWGPEELNLFVAVFVTCRFPTVLAVNKADHPNASSLIEAVRREFPGAIVESMCAKAESVLLNFRRKNEASYIAGSTTASWQSEAPVPADFVWARSVVDALRGTGVTRVLQSAFAVRPSSLAFASDDLSTATLGGKVLPRVDLFHPRSTVEDLARSWDEGRAFARAEILELLPNKAVRKSNSRKDGQLPAQAILRVFFR